MTVLEKKIFFLLKNVVSIYIAHSTHNAFISTLIFFDKQSLHIYEFIMSQFTILRPFYEIHLIFFSCALMLTVMLSSCSSIFSTSPMSSFGFSPEHLFYLSFPLFDSSPHYFLYLCIGSLPDLTPYILLFIWWVSISLTFRFFRAYFSLVFEVRRLLLSSFGTCFSFPGPFLSVFCAWLACVGLLHGVPCYFPEISSSHLL